MGKLCTGLLLMLVFGVARAGDCAEHPAPQRCMVLQQTSVACVDLRGDAQTRCEARFAVPLTCRPADDAACLQRQRAFASCQNLQGAALRTCLVARQSPASCANHDDPGYCERLRSAERHCQLDFTTSERSCVAARTL